MGKTETRAISIIRQRARSQKLTQKRIASKMGTSLSTVKRWWSGVGIDLTVIDGLCGLVGMTMSELFSEMEGQAKYTYSSEQEKLLASNPHALAVFDLLASGQKPSAIQRRYALSDPEISGLLAKLDKAGLIELGVGNRVRLVKSGEPQWIVGGPLSQRYRRPMIDAFLGDHGKESTTFFIHDYFEDDALLLQSKLKELTRMMEALNSRGMSKPEDTKSYGVYVSLKPFEWDIRSVLSKKNGD